MPTCRWTVLALLTTCTFAAPRLAAQAPPQEKSLKDYLTDDGKLRAPLEVRDEKKGFGTFAGQVYRVAPDGAWSITEIFRRQPTLRAQGVLSAKELKKLASVLLANDALDLPTAGRPLVNPHVMTINYGGCESVLTFGVDQVARRPRAGDPDPGIVGRYGAIAGVVRELLQNRNP
jgi:hypothetical protein